MQIFHAFGAIVGGLSGGVADALEQRPGRDCGGGCEQFGYQRRLIEAALAFAGRMQWHRHDKIEMPAAKPRVAHAFAEPARDWMAEVALLSIFELMEDVANEAATAIRGHRGLEIQFPVLAIRAAKRLSDRAGKGLGALRTEGRDDAWCALLAIGAKIFGTFHGGRTNRAGGRIEERRRRGADSRYRDGQH